MKTFTQDQGVAVEPERRFAPQWIKVLDHTRCIGCHACTVACKSENEVPLDVSRTYVKHVETGLFPDTRRHFQVTRCNQCADPPCVHACPTTAMYQRNDGLVDFDKNVCIGCKACIAACPYDAIFINPEDGSAEKCNFCAHKLDKGLEPACVTVCPAEAILIGDLNDPTNKVAEIVGREPVNVRRPEKHTKPKMYYLGVDQATLDPLAANTPVGGLFGWSEQKRDLEHGYVTSGMPAGWRANNAAASLLSYDVNHKRPWDYRVSLYTWTKSIGAGAMLFTALGVLLGWLPLESALAQWVAPLVATLFLAATGALLIWDLTHPWRFFYIFLRPQWRSWLVKGAFIIAAYGAILALWLAGSVFGLRELQGVLLWLTLPAALMTAVYTAFLFAQAKARDLWQNPLLPFHMGLQALLAGAAVMGIAAAFAGEAIFLAAALWTLAISASLHVLVVWGEIALPTVTAHAKVAERHMTRGIFKGYFWGGILGGGVLPVLLIVLFPNPVGLVLAALAALAGLLAYEHAYVQAGQAVPLA
jgi:Fe-S-cluster-containing dehydrogenase component/formate-dependent nitrite reductase membrane component NrfD